MNGSAIAPEGMLRVSWYVSRTDCLGPGNRSALWVQGCGQRCPGCIAEPLQDMSGGYLKETEALAQEIISSRTQGLTISGGEPFLQAYELSRMVKTIRTARPDMGVIVFTGLIYEELKKQPDRAALLEQTDLLIDGAYIKELDDGRPMRGSSNQRLIYLTDRYSPADMPDSRRNKVIFTGNTFRMTGIPSAGAKLLMDSISAKKQANNQEVKK